VSIILLNVVSLQPPSPRAKGNQDTLEDIGGASSKPLCSLQRTLYWVNAWIAKHSDTKIDAHEAILKPQTWENEDPRDAPRGVSRGFCLC